MPRHGTIMLQHEEHSRQNPEANMPQHDLGMSQHAKAVQKGKFEGMPHHDKSMPRHDNDKLAVYFWQVG